jgi:hypothetical protein
MTEITGRLGKKPHTNQYNTIMDYNYDAASTRMSLPVAGIENFWH